MRDLLADNPLLLLFACLAVGSVIGSLRVRGFMLGPAAVLFTALALSAWDARLELPAILGQLGLAVFAYCIGIASGSSFFGALRSGGITTMLEIGALVAACGALTYGLARAFGLSSQLAAGVFSGALTNTPALAAATEQADGSATPTVGYSVTYLAGVLVMMGLAAWALGRRGSALETEPEEQAEIVNVTLEVTHEGLPPVAALAHDPEHPVLFSRVKHDGEVEVPSGDTVLQPGDLVSAIGRQEDIDALEDRVGPASDENIVLDRGQLDMRRITLSSRRLSGLTVAQLDLEARFGAVASRVRRGDVDFLATDDLVVQQGDRVRVIAPRERLPEVATYLGDSERGPADLNPIGLSVGLSLGLLLGLLPLPSPAGGTFVIGLAAGPLVAGLILGRLSRTGPIAWAVPYNASIALQQLGLLIFLASAGSRAGGELVHALRSPEGVRIFVSGLIVTTVAAIGLVVVARLRGLGGPRLAGVVAGAQTQPAVLAYAQERTTDQRVGLGYALVYPAAMLVKILAAQILVIL